MDNLLKVNLTNDAFNYPLSNEPLNLPDLAEKQIALDILRLDRIHPVISGNKWFKLKGWLQEARLKGHTQLLTFGGAWSNHIVAAAFAAKAAGLKATGIIRGEMPAQPSQTLLDAQSYGMQLEFVSRDQYRQRSDPAWLDRLADQYPHACIIPEGGAGTPGIKGCAEILRVTDTSSYSHICCAVGTGTMFQGLAQAAAPHQAVLGFPVLKGITDLPIQPSPSSSQPSPANPTSPLASPAPASPHSQTRLIPGYHFGGYGRHTPELLQFMNQLFQTTAVPTDFVYTAKLSYGVIDMIRNNLFPPGSRLLIIHSGGLQGNRSLSPGVLYF